MKSRNMIGRIARSTLTCFVLIHAALLFGAFVLHSGARAGISLSVICPVLGGVLSYLVERNAAQVRHM